MAYYSIVRYVSDGVSKIFAVPFDYLEKRYVKVYVNGEEEDYTWLSDTQIELRQVPPAGAVVAIQRDTPKYRLVDFKNASILDEYTLDRDGTQLIHVVQESLDKSEDALRRDVDDAYNALGKRIKNVARPQHPNDAVNKSYADEVITIAQGHANRAETAANNAQHYANVAVDHASKAEASEIKAAMWAEAPEDEPVENGKYSAKHHAAKAKASENAAKQSEDNARASADAAAQSESKAAQSEANALASENKAYKWAEQDVDVPVESGKFSAKHHATKASESATAAAQSEANAKASEQAAKASEINAQTSASNAAASEANAEIYKNQAQNYAQDAASSASNAAASEDKARQWANAPEGVEVEPGEYSAYHWAKQAQYSAGEGVKSINGIPGDGGNIKIEAGNGVTITSDTAAKKITVGTDITPESIGAAPESHTHSWSEITSKPSSFPPSSHTHSWSEITSKPSSFPPSSHTHAWSDITGAPATATRWPSWSEVTGKPSTFPPSAHNHNDLYYTKSEVDSKISSVPNIEVVATGTVTVNHGSYVDINLKPRGSGAAYIASVYSDEDHAWFGGTGTSGFRPAINYMPSSGGSRDRLRIYWNRSGSSGPSSRTCNYRVLAL